jgi:hypothetical protein
MRSALIGSAAVKPARRNTLGERIEAPKVLRDDVYVQEAGGRAETLLAAARAYYFDVMSDLWATLADGSQPSERHLHYSPPPTHTSSAFASRWFSSSTKQQAAGQSIRRVPSIAASATVRERLTTALRKLR